MLLKDDIIKFLGQKVAVLCARFQYRGILSEIGDDYLVLSYSTAVLQSGDATGPSPEAEDWIISDIRILFRMIELVYQPKWCFAKLPMEGKKIDPKTVSTSEVEKIEDYLIGGRFVEIMSDRITVGCTVIPFDKAKSIYDKMVELRKNEK